MPAQRRTAIFTALLVTASLSPLAAQEWAGKGRAQGIVQDEAGNPVEGAKVTLRYPAAAPRGGPEPVFTNKRGRWSALGLLGGNWQVLIELQGFLISEGVYYVNEFQPSPPVEVTLTRDPSASIDVGEALLEAGSYAEARAAYLQALDGMDELGQARLRTRIGDTYLAEGQAAAARAEYEQALPVIPPEEQTHVRLQIANSYQTEGDYPAAREYYEAVLPGLPAEGQAQVLQTIAQGYGAEGNNAVAIAALERANGLAPGNPAVLQLLVDLLMREGRESDAEAYLAQLPADMTLPTDMVLNMGIRLYNEGNMDEALGYFERAVAEHPEEPEAYYYRGLSYLSQGRNDEARADFQKLLELEPDTSHRGEVEEFLQFLEQGS